MAYIKQTWSNGETITAEKLNHIEDGIYSASTDSISEEQIEQIIDGVS